MKLLLVAFIFVCFPAHSQISIDSILHSVKNRDVWIIPKNFDEMLQNSKKGLINQSIEFKVVAPFDINLLVQQYTKPLVIQKLYALLTDTARDFYANMMLYDLLKHDQVRMFFLQMRESWVLSGRKAKDVEYWTSNLNKKLFL